MELKQTLESHGFVVRCVFPTKLGSIFEVWEGGVMHSTVEGEVNFRTNYGEVNAVFMPKPQSFADFRINERRRDGGFLYTFAGTPRVWDTNRFESARRMYFLDHDNLIFFIDDVVLLHRLEQALQARHRRLQYGRLPKSQGRNIAIMLKASPGRSSNAISTVPRLRKPTKPGAAELIQRRIS